MVQADRAQERNRVVKAFCGGKWLVKMKKSPDPPGTDLNIVFVLKAWIGSERRRRGERASCSILTSLRPMSIEPNLRHIKNPISQFKWQIQGFA